jgi:hypothetical protein
MFNVFAFKATAAEKVNGVAPTVIDVEVTISLFAAGTD